MNIHIGDTPAQLGWLPPEEITAVVEKNLQAYREALAEANETTRIWKKRYNDLSAHINSINTQNAELVALVESLRKLFPLKVLVGCDGHLSYPVSQYNDVVEVFNKTPAQHLRDRDAEVGRAGLVASNIEQLNNCLAALQIANKRIDKLEKYNLDLANESHNKSNMIDYGRSKNEDAGRAGFVAGYHKMHIEFVGSLAPSGSAESAADQYAEKVRRGEV